MVMRDGCVANTVLAIADRHLQRIRGKLGSVSSHPDDVGFVGVCSVSDNIDGVSVCVVNRAIAGNGILQCGNEICLGSKSVIVVVDGLCRCDRAKVSEAALACY